MNGMPASPARLQMAAKVTWPRKKHAQLIILLSGTDKQRDEKSKSLQSLGMNHLLYLGVNPYHSLVEIWMVLH